MTAIVQTKGLEKRYGEVHAVRGVSFEIAAGSCIGLLGPNGAGKTTTMRMLLGLTRPSAGDVRVFGAPIAALGRGFRTRIGLVPQDDNLDPDLSVRQNLEVYGRYFGIPAGTLATRVPQLLAFMQLEERGAAKVMQLSGGMKRRLIIARSLIADPELIVLDEPTTGLDPQARVLIWRRLLDLKRQGKTLLLTTHYMDEAQRLCDRIIVIDGGRVLDEGTPRELIARHVAGHVFEIAKPVPADLLPEGLEREDIGDSLLVYTADPHALRDRLPAEIEYVHRVANLEDVFLRLTGRRLREA
ncbi:MAG: ATP-binding cassette domain-containing protein [Alphaproteobacteria bacterium]|nr:ATP-binding cassette domain-containing protein [Alphaproteobacteria bacterium]